MPTKTAGATMARDHRSALVPSTLLIVAILLVAANLRPAVTSLGSVLAEVRTSLGVSSAWASVLTALPGLCFGLAGFLAPTAARQLGMARAIGLSMVLVTVGVLVRVTDGPDVVLIGTLVACAGVAVCNVLLPVVVKESFPHRIGLVTGLYTAVLQTAAALGSLITPPVDDAVGGWRPALGEWGLLAALGTIGWLLAARHARRPEPSMTTEAPVAAPAGPMLRSRLAWAVTAFFGLQSMFAYAVMGWAPQVLMSGGVSRSEAGAMLAMMSVLGVPLSLLIAPVAARQRSQSGWLAGISAVGAIGVIGLLIAPSAAPWLWAVALGIGMGVFPIAVAIITLRTRTSADTRRLSTMAQGIGYLLAALGPLLFGILHGATGGWTASLLVMLVGIGLQVMIGVFAGRPRYV
jgi:MFS transporter, CP family, cyanate transporter